MSHQKQEQDASQEEMVSGKDKIYFQQFSLTIYDNKSDVNDDMDSKSGGSFLLTDIG